VEWQQQGTWTDISYATAEGIAKITIRRPEVRNAFRPKTLFELEDAFELARDDPAIGVPTPSAPAATSASAATTATSTSTASAASTCSTSRSRSGGCPSR